jgi:hypothetical protein
MGLLENEVAMASNHRLLHGRTEFQDPNRHMIRILAWFDEPIETAPEELIQPARKVLKKIEEITRHDALWMRSVLAIETPETEFAELPPLVREVAAKILHQFSHSKMADTFYILEQEGKYRDEYNSYVLLAMMKGAAKAIAELPDENKRAQAMVEMFNRLQKGLSSKTRKAKKQVSKAA